MNIYQNYHKFLQHYPMKHFCSEKFPYCKIFKRPIKWFLLTPQKEIFHITVYYFLISHCKNTSLFFICLAHPTVSEPTGQFPTWQSTPKDTALQQVPTGTLWNHETNSIQLPTRGTVVRARPVGYVALGVGQHPSAHTHFAASGHFAHVAIQTPHR